MLHHDFKPIKRLSQLAQAAVLGALSLNSYAVEYIPKPGFALNSAEFGSAVARNGIYTLVGADRDGEKNPNTNAPGGHSGNTGVLRIFDDWSSSPLREFSIVNTEQMFQAFAGFVPPPEQNIVSLNLGSSVEMSNRWIVASINFWSHDPVGAGSFTAPALFVVDRGANGSLGPVCPTHANGLVNCYDHGDGFVDGIELISLPADVQLGRKGSFGVAASDKHIAYVSRDRTNSSNVNVRVLTYDDAAPGWSESSSFPTLPASNSGTLTVDVTDEYLVVGLGGSNSPNSGSVYYSEWDSSAQSWKPLQLLTRNVAFFGESVSVNRAGDVVIGSGKYSSYGNVYFYRFDKNTTTPLLLFEKTFYTNSPVKFVEIDGNHALAYLSKSEDRRVVSYHNQNRLLSNGALDSKWHRFGHVDFTAVSALPNNGSPSFEPSDMGISDGIASFGWKGTKGAGQVINVGGLVRQLVADTYDPSTDTYGQYDLTVGSGTLALDEQHALLPDNVPKSTVASGTFNQGLFVQSNGMYDPQTSKVGWPVYVPTAGDYNVCIRYINLSSSTAAIILQNDGVSFDLLPGLTPSYSWAEVCGTVSLPSGRFTLGIYSWATPLLFDQITVF